MQDGLASSVGRLSERQAAALGTKCCRHLRRRAGFTKGRDAESLLRLIEAERARRALPGNILSFLKKFPLGFSDPLYRKEERDDKVEASAVCHSVLTQQALEVGAEEDPAPLVKQVKRLVSMTT